MTEKSEKRREVCAKNRKNSEKCPKFHKNREKMRQKYEKHAKQEAKNIISRLENYIQVIEKKFQTFNDVQKNYAMANLLNILHGWQPIIEIINKETRIKSEKRKFDSLVKRAYDILKDETGEQIDGRPFLRRLLHLKASEPMIIMNKFLEEFN